MLRLGYAEVDITPKGPVEMVCQKIEEALQDAAKRLHEVGVGCGNAYVDIGVNRREGNQSLDKRAGILKICSATEVGRTELLLLRLTAHCNALRANFGRRILLFERIYQWVFIFPTEEEFDLGGYEVYWSMLMYYAYYNRVFPFMRESASKFLEFVTNNVPKA